MSASIPDHPILMFGTHVFLGGVLEVPREAPELQTWRHHFAGVAGETEIVGRPGGRDLAFQMLLFDRSFSTRDKLFKYVEETLNGARKGLIGTNNEVEYISNDPDWKETWRNCTCEGFFRTGPYLPDFAGTLGGGWITSGTLRFRQLLTKD